MADPEIPEAAIGAAAEVLARYYKAAWPDDPVDPPLAPFVGEAREVLAAALPHLDGDALVKLINVRKVRDDLAKWREIVWSTRPASTASVSP